MSWTNEEKVEAILAWADDGGGGGNFDTSFVDSLFDQMERGRELTGSQEDAVDNIIEKFRIDVGEYV